MPSSAIVIKIAIEKLESFVDDARGGLNEGVRQDGTLRRDLLLRHRSFLSWQKELSPSL